MPCRALRWCIAALVLAACVTTTRAQDARPVHWIVAFPAGGGNLPLIIQMHGWGGSKADVNPTPWVKRGYAVLSYTSRGFAGSCGTLAARGIAPPDPTALAGCAQWRAHEVLARACAGEHKTAIDKRAQRCLVQRGA